MEGMVYRESLENGASLQVRAHDHSMFAQGKHEGVTGLPSDWFYNIKDPMSLSELRPRDEAVELT